MDATKEREAGLSRDRSWRYRQRNQASTSTVDKATLLQTKAEKQKEQARIRSQRYRKSLKTKTGSQNPSRSEPGAIADELPTQPSLVNQNPDAITTDPPQQPLSSGPAGSPIRLRRVPVSSAEQNEMGTQSDVERLPLANESGLHIGTLTNTLDAFQLDR